jgi:hypothetical protein
MGYGWDKLTGSREEGGKKYEGISNKKNRLMK